MTAHAQQTESAGELGARRQTPTERYHELALQAAASRPATPEHSLELTRNAKGDVQIALTVRGVDLDELERDATESFDRLCAKYQRADAPAPAGGEAVK